MHGDFGTSVMTSQPVLRDMLDVSSRRRWNWRRWRSLIGVVLGVPLGVVAAAHRGRWQDHLVRGALGLFGYSMPVFWLGLMGLLLFYAKLGWVAGPGRIDVGYDDLVDPRHRPAADRRAARLAMATCSSTRCAIWSCPASMLGYLSLAYIARMTRSFMLGQLRQEYVLAARAKGLPSSASSGATRFGNVLVPLITVIALTFAQPAGGRGADRDGVRLAGPRASTSRTRCSTPT